MLALRAFRETTLSGPSSTAGPAAHRRGVPDLQVPLIVFRSPPALADRISKRTVVLAVKVFEIALMLACCGLLVLEPHGGNWLFVVLAGLGLHSALFSPAKYGIVPELVPHERLSASNGLLEMWTVIAIISGTAAGGWLLGASGEVPDAGAAFGPGGRGRAGGADPARAAAGAGSPWPRPCATAGRDPPDASCASRSWARCSSVMAKRSARSAREDRARPLGDDVGRAARRDRSASRAARCSPRSSRARRSSSAWCRSAGSR
jgi:hypothetical protein